MVPTLGSTSSRASELLRGGELSNPDPLGCTPDEDAFSIDQRELGDRHALHDPGASGEGIGLGPHVRPLRRKGGAVRRRAPPFPLVCRSPAWGEGVLGIRARTT